MNFFYKTWNHYRHILQKCYKQVVANKKKLNAVEKDEARLRLSNLERAIETKDRADVKKASSDLENFCHSHLKKPWYKSIFEFALALGVALLVASVVRAMWFELYVIPTGSMRPTFKEQDHLTVSKAQFGVNIPFATDHFTFDPSLVKRTGIIIFSGDKLPVIDSDTTFLGFPYKKRYIKRLIGKPGDQLYFYGGQIYGIDQDGNEIREFLDNPNLNKIEHIPYISFVGHVDLTRKNEVLFKHMNVPVARIKMTVLGPKGEFFNGKNWTDDDLGAAKKEHDGIKTFGDLWGMNNYGMVELLTKQELEKDPKIALQKLPEGLLYLVIRHHPTMQKSKNFEIDGPLIGTYPFVEKSIIPLDQTHLNTILDNMYTMRFVVKDGKAKRYSLEEIPFSANSLRMEGIPDGTYEFYYGKAYREIAGGFLQELAADHPLYEKSPQNIQKLFNLGMNMDRSFEPSRNHPLALPSRYTYFRNGDLYLLGAPILKQQDEALQQFVKSEMDKEKDSDTYVPFIDQGAPIQDGKLNKNFITTFGLKIPEKNYLVLGDNHAMSADSRIFGFVPEENLQGVPDVVLWPDPRSPNQPSYPIFTFPRAIVWALMGVIGLIWYGIYRYRLRKPIDLTKI